MNGNQKNFKNTKKRYKGDRMTFLVHPDNFCTHRFSSNRSRARLTGLAMWCAWTPWLKHAALLPMVAHVYDGLAVPTTHPAATHVRHSQWLPTLLCAGLTVSVATHTSSNCLGAHRALGFRSYFRSLFPLILGGVQFPLVGDFLFRLFSSVGTFNDSKK